jgi:hypothetical protein
MTRERYVEEFGKLLKDRGITHFTPLECCPVGREVQNKVTGETVQLTAPHSALWNNAILTLDILEWLRKESGSPLLVLSGYRDPGYNRAVGGSKGSLHMIFNAFDVRSRKVSPVTLARTLLQHRWAKHLGIGVYPQEGFLHVDSRGLLGHESPARWGLWA